MPKTRHSLEHKGHFIDGAELYAPKTSKNSILSNGGFIAVLVTNKYADKVSVGHYAQK